MADPQLNPYATPSEEFLEDSQGESGAPDTTGADLQDLDQDPRFRAWKSKMDKQIAERDHQLAQLQQAQVIADDPNVLTQQRTRLYQTWQQAQTAAERAQEEGDNDTFLAAATQAARLADKVFETDVKLTAARRNVKMTPALRQTLDEAYENGGIRGPQDIDYILLTYEDKPVNGTASVKPADMDAFVDKLKKDLELELRAKMGLSVPGVQPGPTPGSRAKLTKELEAAKTARDMPTYLGLLRQLDSLTE